MAIRNIIVSIPLRTFDAADLGTRYIPINPEGLDESCFLIIINNDSDEGIFLSFDGIQDSEYIAPRQVWRIQGMEAVTAGQKSQWRKGTKIYIKSDCPGTGTISLSGYYQPTS